MESSDNRKRGLQMKTIRLVSQFSPKLVTLSMLSYLALC